jgi:hypothetical protein
LAGSFSALSCRWVPRSSEPRSPRRIDPKTDLSEVPAEDRLPQSPSKPQNSSRDEVQLIARSPAMGPVLEPIARIGPSDTGDLISGEHGTGKDLVARTLHAVSERASRPLVTVNLGGLSMSLFPSDLFGHVKGAFTDARSIGTKGLVLRAPPTCSFPSSRPSRPEAGSDWSCRGGSPKPTAARWFWRTAATPAAAGPASRFPSSTRRCRRRNMGGARAHVGIVRHDQAAPT